MCILHNILFKTTNITPIDMFADEKNHPVTLFTHDYGQHKLAQIIFNQNKKALHSYAREIKPFKWLYADILQPNKSHRDECISGQYAKLISQQLKSASSTIQDT